MEMMLPRVDIPSWSSHRMEWNGKLSGTRWRRTPLAITTLDVTRNLDSMGTLAVELL
jgi:hypothetical protein